MELSVLAGLGVLALVDGTSVGTLGIPVWLGLQPGVRSRMIFRYLVAIAAFYWAVGVVLFAGAAATLEGVLASTQGDARSWLQLVVGLALLAASFWVDPVGKSAKRRKAERVAARRRAHGPSTLERLRGAAVRDGLTGRAAVVLAVAAASIELVSMLPYLAAIGVLVEAEPGPLVGGGVLMVYAALMILPTLLLLLARVIAAQRAARVLARVQQWMDRNSRASVGILLGVGGLYLAADAAGSLGFI